MDVIVVGGDIAGLATAHRLATSEYDDLNPPETSAHAIVDMVGDLPTIDLNKRPTPICERPELRGTWRPWLARMSSETVPRGISTHRDPSTTTSPRFSRAMTLAPLQR